MTAQKLIIGNWKMNGLLADAKERVATLLEHAKTAPKSAITVLCPPATLLQACVQQTSGAAIHIGGQDCHAEKSGAFTGNISAEMLKDIGCSYVILGHSERRQYHAETSEQVAAKAKAAHAQGLIAVICVGETDAERSAGTHHAVVLDQISKSVPDTSTADNTVIAYEPVWAIGTGKTATQDDVADMHKTIHDNAPAYRILYGGSVKASNAREILHTADVDGVLVGGASLKTDEFGAIIDAAGTA